MPEKAAFLPQRRVLLIADIHLGKATHFRKSGIIIPAPDFSRDLHGVEALIKSLQPGTVVFLGDLFHSEWNREWIMLKDFLSRHAAIRFVLTKGNHDILPTDVFEETDLEVVDTFPLGEHLLCSHEPLREIQENVLNIAGHVHPGVVLSTKGRQHYRLPCFYHLGQVLVLPAFGHLTGLQMLKKAAGARVFPVFPTEVVALNS